MVAPLRVNRDYYRFGFLPMFFVTDRNLTTIESRLAANDRGKTVNVTKPTPAELSLAQRPRYAARLAVL